MKVETQIWAEQGPMDPRLTKDEGLEYWGTAHGSFDLLTPTSTVTTREAEFSWENEGETSPSTFSKGIDLILEYDIVDGVDIAPPPPPATQV